MNNIGTLKIEVDVHGVVYEDITGAHDFWLSVWVGDDTNVIQDMSIPEIIEQGIFNGEINSNYDTRKEYIDKEIVPALKDIIAYLEGKIVDEQETADKGIAR